MKFSENLKELRLSKGLTQTELAEKTGLSISDIDKWENDKKNPKVKSLIILANFFDKSIDYLVLSKKDKN